MQGGKIGGVSILPDGWVAEATRAQVPHYGFQWWVKQDDGSYDAEGIFGQTIHVDPKGDLVIVTSSAWPTADDEKYWKNGSAYFAAVADALRGH